MAAACSQVQWLLEVVKNVSQRTGTPDSGLHGSGCLKPRPRVSLAIFIRRPSANLLFGTHAPRLTPKEIDLLHESGQHQRDVGGEEIHHMTSSIFALTEVRDRSPTATRPRFSWDFEITSRGIKDRRLPPP